MPQDTIKAVRATMAADKAAQAKIDAAQDAKIKDIDEMVRWCCAALKNAPSQATVDAQPPPVVSPPPPPPPVVVSPPPPPPPTDDTSVTVSTTAEYMAALRAASPNSTIRLRAGTYNGAGMQYLAAPNVTVCSYDNANKAVITNFDCFFSSGVTWRDVYFSAVAPAYYCFQFYQCSNIHLLRVRVKGNVGADPQQNAEGVSIQLSNNVSVIGCEMTVLQRALAFYKCNDGIVTDNHIHNVEVTGMMLEQVKRFSVGRNYIHEFHAVLTGPYPGHPDCIQGFTENSDDSTEDLDVFTNLLCRGAGNIGPQGVFFGVAKPFPFKRFTIRDQLMVGTGYNGIKVGETNAFDVITVDGNKLLSLDGDLLKTWINLGSGANATVTNNEAIIVSHDPTITNYSESGTVINTPTLDLGAAVIAAWLAARPDFTAYNLSL